MQTAKLAPSKSKGSNTAPAALPTMPDLKILDNEHDDDDDDDPQDENHLMSILQKLKSAKQTLDGSRQRKKAKQMVDQTSSRFATDADEIINKHNKRWGAKFGAIQQKVKKLMILAEGKLKSWEENSAECERRLNAHKIGVQNILRALADLEKEFKNTKSAKDAATAAEIARIRQQVADKLRQVQELLIRAHSRSSKDDKFTKIIKTFIASF